MMKSMPPSLHMSISPTQNIETQQQYEQYQQQRAVYRRCRRRMDTVAGATAATTPFPSSSSSSSTISSIYYQATSRQVLNPYNPLDIQRLDEGSRMAKYALAIYTWMLYVFVHPITGFPRLCCRSSCKVCCIHKFILDSNNNENNTRQQLQSQSPQGIHVNQGREEDRSRRHNRNQGRRGRRRRSSSREDDLLSPTSNDLNASGSSNEDDDINSTYDDYQNRRGRRRNSVGDNICEWHKHALLLVAGLQDADLVYAQFQNRFSLVPYCILLDHDHSVVVLSIRGSLSLEDVVTDTLVVPEPLDALGEQYGFDGTGQYCHAGVLACFENIYQDLRRHGLLEKLLEEDYPTYELRIVGHSLVRPLVFLRRFVFVITVS